MSDRKTRGERRAAAKALWRATRRGARNAEDLSFGNVWGWVNDTPAQTRNVNTAKDQRK